jgi:hypothetical protein
VTERFWEGIIQVGSVLAGGVVAILGSIATAILQSRREERRVAREAVGTAARRLSRVCSLTQAGSQLTANRDAQMENSRACADEFDELSIILFSGPKQPPQKADDLMREARLLCACWKALATRLWEGDEKEKSARSTEIGELTARIYTTAVELRPLVRAVWGVR